MQCHICHKEGVFGLFPFANYVRDFDCDDLVYRQEYLPICPVCQITHGIRKDVDNELGLG